MRVAPWVRVAIIIISTFVIGLLSHFLTGNIIPTGPKEALIFQNALLLIVLGSTLLEYHYTKPADSVINSLMGLVTLLSVYSIAPKLPWIIVTLYCLVVFLISTACVAVSSGKNITGWKKIISEFTYRPSVVLGKARILFSIVFLSALWFFYSLQDQLTISLLLFWGVFIVIWPLNIPQFFTSLFDRGSESLKLGEITRRDNPNILRVTLEPDINWENVGPQIAVLPNGDTFWAQPLYSQFHEENLLGTALLTSIPTSMKFDLKNVVISPTDDFDTPSEEEINESLGGGEESQILGFVIERSNIQSIKFETLDSETCSNGMLVWTKVKDHTVYYQIIAGETNEETFTSNKHGFQIATATQLGIFEKNEGFKKVDWLPSMNSPVFTANDQNNIALQTIRDEDFKLGVIPNTSVPVGGDFAKNYNYHTAILGVTGSGKTELGFDIIRHSVEKGKKVICIDLTAQYKGKLDDLEPIDLSINRKTSTELSQKLFDVESGSYGAGDEKKALKEFIEPIRDQVADRISEFILEKNSGIGIIRLEDISNTKASLWITELYMSALLKYSRDNPDDFPGTLVVVEEAHTVMPEPSTMGLSDYDSRGLVGKIAQIALQGRKYGVGLLVLAQRTATVSKTVLTQCNTIISFSCYDDTSLGFLKNLYGQEFIDLIPSLPQLHAIAFGQWVKNQRPIVFEVPFDESKV